MIRALLVLALVLGIAPAVQAHEVRPAYLEITESAPGRYAVLWHTPVTAGMRLPVALRFPDDVRDLHEPTVQELNDSLLERRTVEAKAGGLAGKRVAFVGLQGTITDVLVRVSLLDGTRSTRLVGASEPWVEIAATSGPRAVFRAYLEHGLGHILFGFDHLLFVLALVLVVPNRRALFVTITAFTVAHSMTLALGTLGVVHAPGPPVEAAIALSVLLLAKEIVRRERGEAGLTTRYPWVIAFAFGLLHGFGFARALTDVGLPQAEAPLALFAFNVGVEGGQLAFVGALLGVLWLGRRVRTGARVAELGLRVAPYAIGTLAAFWFFERLAEF